MIPIGPNSTKTLESMKEKPELIYEEPELINEDDYELIQQENKRLKEYYEILKKVLDEMG